MIRKECSAGVGYSVVNLNDVTHVFASAVPQQGHTLHEQATDALRTIEAVTRDQSAPGTIVRQAVFLRSPGQMAECREIMHGFYGEHLPATSYIIQPPCAGKQLEIEAWGVGRGDDGVQIDRVSEHLVVVHHHDTAWAHCAGIAPQTAAADVYGRSLDAFQRMEAGLRRVGCRYDQVFRTWLYLGDIIGPEKDTQRYKELNRARADFYEPLTFLPKLAPAESRAAVYPASTGIGTGSRDVVMGCIALATERDDITLLPLENPRQTPAFDYGTQYSPKSPKFCRAMAVIAEGCASIFISGTASIVASDTKCVGDVEGQTRQTIENIENLIAEANLAAHGQPGQGATLADLALVRVYIKHRDDYTKVRAVCEARLGEVPTVYAVADVCRPELLVELEGIAFSHQGAGEPRHGGSP